MKREGKPVKEVLHLVLSYKWYDMIESGEKPEEYRKKTKYWEKRLTTTNEAEAHEPKNPIFERLFEDGKRVRYYLKNFESIVFHRAYTSTTMEWKIRKAELSIGYEEWGAPGDELVFTLKLAERIR